MNVLVINCGSSSLKYQLIESKKERVMAKGLCERIGLDGHLIHKGGRMRKPAEFDDPLPDHMTAVERVLKLLTDPKYGSLKSLNEIDAVGHRVVHGGEWFASSTLINEEVILGINNCCDLAPLHNPANLTGIEACRKLMPKVPMVAVFDTAFHQTMPPEAFLYGIPYKYYTKYRIRKYGFHGTSHRYVAQRMAAILEKEFDQLNAIICHLGNGASICGVENGKSIDTSMGLTPLDGLVMGTRCGTIDPSVIPYMASKDKKSLRRVMDILNKQSGVEGVSGVSSDFRDLEAAIQKGNAQAKLALDQFCYRAAQYIGAYASSMSRVDAIVFTAGIGENNGTARAGICKRLKLLGLDLDEEQNQKRGEEVQISTSKSAIPVWVIPTNEEIAIARDTVELVNKHFGY